MTAIETRADRFTRELGELKISAPAAGRSTLWLRSGVVLMVLGIVLGVVGYLVSHNTSDSLVQRDAITIAITGIPVSVVGAALYLRYSITGFLRFWMARQSYDMNRSAEAASDGEVRS